MLETKKSCVLVGMSGHAYVVAETAELSGFRIEGYTEFERKKHSKMELAYLGFEGDDAFWNSTTVNSFALGVGNNEIRKRVFSLIKAKDATCLTLIHPEASISKHSHINEGTFIARSVSVNPFCKVGAGAILNTSCSVDHDCIIEDFVHIAPGAVLCGDVRVGESSFVGANSVIKEGITIGRNVLIGAGSVVLRDIPDDRIVWGNPAKAVKK